MARLKKRQKEALLAWIAEGLESDEINERATQFKPPFVVTRQLVDHYRKSRRIDLAALQREAGLAALSSGLALKANRVQRLQLLAGLLEQDLFGGFLWLEQVKSIGGGPNAKEIEYEEFNSEEVQQYRGILDDIAKEMGERRQGVDIALEREIEAALDKLRDNLTADEYARVVAVLAGAGGAAQA